MFGACTSTKVLSSRICIHRCTSIPGRDIQIRGHNLVTHANTNWVWPNFLVWSPQLLYASSVKNKNKNKHTTQESQTKCRPARSALTLQERLLGHQSNQPCKCAKGTIFHDFATVLPCLKKNHNLFRDACQVLALKTKQNVTCWHF